MSFERPGLSEIDQRVRSDIEATMTDVPIVRRGTVLAGIARGLAGAAHSVHGHARWVFDQIFPDTADSAQLERQAGFYGIVRAEPSPAAGEVMVTGDDGVLLGNGVIFRSADGIEFRPTETAVIADGVALIDVEATEVGAAGNLATDDPLTFLTPVAGVDTDAAVADPGFAGGADAETDARLLERLLLRLRRPPHGGAHHDYVQWAFEVPGVTRVWISPHEMGVGTVTIRFVVDDAPHGPVPNSGELAAVKDYIEALRPVTASAIFVVAPDLVPVNHSVALTPNTAEVRAAVLASLADLYQREGAPGATIPLTHVAEAISTAPGETDHVLSIPSTDITPAKGQMPVLGTVTFQ